MRAVGVEPTRTLVLGILSPVRLPLRHARKNQATFKKSGFEPEMSIFQIDAFTIWLLFGIPELGLLHVTYLYFLQDRDRAF